MPAERISITEAKENKLFYVVASAQIYRQMDGRCLIMKRDEREKVHPGRWGVIGGKLEWGDLDLRRPSRLNGDVLDFEGAIEQLLVREAREEAQVQIGGPFHYLSSMVFVRPDGIPVVFTKFAGRYLSGEVVPEAGGFTEAAWVNGDEVGDYACIDGIDEELRQTIRHFGRR